MLRRKIGDVEFTAIVEPNQPMRGLEVPAGVVASLGSQARPRVVVTANGHSWSTRIAKLRGRHLIGVSNAHREAAGLADGDSVVVSVTLDATPVTAPEPGDLASALDADPTARATFDSRTVSQRRQYIRVIEQAKKPETRQRRIAALVEQLSTPTAPQ